MSSTRHNVKPPRGSPGVKNTPPTRNQILARLPREDFERLRAELETVSLSVRQKVFDQGQPIEWVYFPESGVISLVKILTDGGPIEAATVGNEGVAGLPVLLGLDIAPVSAFCQIPGVARRLKAATLIAERERGGPFAGLMLRYAGAIIAMLAQSVACNRVHPMKQRLCRWLLMTHDRVGTDEFLLTQEFLAQMLGVRRPTVNIAGTALQKAGLIRYSRGRITIVDRKRLEGAACECYAAIRREFKRALPSPVTVW
jgi:CRP-like cAMP-binding protein